MQAATETTDGFLNLSFTDWERKRRAHLEGVPAITTLSELLSEVRGLLGLPAETAYQAVLDGVQLRQTDTLGEAGITPDAELEIIPEVQAGGGPAAA